MERRNAWGWCGAAYAVLVLVALFSGGESPVTDEEFAEFYGDPATRAADFLFYVEVLAAALLLVVFTAGVRERLAAVGAGGAAAIAQAAGTASAALLTVSASVAVSVSAAAGQAGFTVDPDTARVVGNVFWFTFTGSIAVLGLLVAAVSAGALYSAAAPRWLGWTGFPVAVLALAASVFFPILLVMVWLAVAGIALALRPATRGATDQPVRP